MWKGGGSWGIINMDMGIHPYGGYGGIRLHGLSQYFHSYAWVQQVGMAQVQISEVQFIATWVGLCLIK